MADHSSIPGTDDGLIEKKVESVTLHEGKFLTLKCDTVELPDGKHATREFVEHPGAVMILPVFDDGRVLLERQFRYPVGRVLLEFPAGKLDPNEDELTCAKRELQEETGYTAREWTFLTRIHPVISYSTEFIDIYLARGLTAGDARLDEGEFLETFIADETQLMDWVKDGSISDVKTIIGVFWLEKIRSGAWKLD
ncbi:NUDIX hydrolase [Burkholderia sp. YI23]|uniref:NUDIX domain-containing protein n=1 Tax=unclassified Caballeronia TaxID=2646786 RepID=UPI000238887E|nr:MULTISPECIES: NUDIX hydrolase [unclassified Caballeronia]AET89524.1 NUDIX hydrolase [Burkholderia sp. YI23]MCE4541426.1 NUDIX hydrolase [Caballeronia sp. PC1]MCE4569530.1 NUDIX hydrolase [Caballeronia sp. CLC5]